MNLDLFFYWKLLIRRFPVILLIITVCSSLGVYTALRLPETFKTKARLIVEEPQIPDSMVTTTVQTSAVEQLDIIQQRLLTRANLIDIANRFDVYDDLREVDPDVIVARMNAATRVIRSAGRNRATAMTIQFEGRSGPIVANVVNEYVTLVLEANMDFRMSRAENTLEFFEEESNRLGAELDAQSVEIATFKSENSEALPEDQSYRLGRQSLMQERLSFLEKDLRALMTQKQNIIQIFQTTGRIGQGANGLRRSAEEQQLIASEAELALALEVYSAENPRVIRLQATVDRLKAIVAAQNSASLPIQNEEPQITAEQAIFEATIVDLDSRIESLQAEIDQTGAELEELQRAIAASSVNGIRLDALERDFAVIQNRYSEAVTNLNEARISERIETTAQGRRITVIENANVPRSPSGPSRPRIAAMGGFVGIALSAAYFVLLEVLNRSIRRPAELVSRFNVTPIATIPYMESRKHKFARRFALIFGSLFVLVSVPALLWYIDTNYIPLDLLVQKILSQLGLG